eukprot:m.6999 g.6999  ORF g.6999 m.6999 type:complete len:68 (-) comp5630_c0_seq1:1524-1727(-)
MTQINNTFVLFTHSMSSTTRLFSSSWSRVSIPLYAMKFVSFLSATFRRWNIELRSTSTLVRSQSLAT